MHQKRYEQVRAALFEHLPPVTLLVGEQYVSFGSLAADVAYHYDVHLTDIALVRAPVTAKDARALVSNAYLVPRGSPFRLVVVPLNDMSEQAQNILLKLLEEPPPKLRVILVSQHLPLPTIVSRCAVFEFGTVAERPDPEAEAAAKVAAAVKAAQSHDAGLLLAACDGFTEEHIRVLHEWAISQAWAARPDLFAKGRKPMEPKVPAKVARRVLRGLALHAKARPVNAAVTALSLAFEEKQDR